MNNLTRFDTESLELFINETGECFASIRGMARMVEVTPKTIRRFLGEAQIERKTAKIPTSQGMQSGDLLDEDGMMEVIIKYNPELFKQFAKLGLRFYLHKVVGFKPQESQPKINIYAHRVQIASKWDIPKGYWCVFHEISLLANKVGIEYPVAEYDLIDGSVGQAWNKYRKCFDWCQETTTFPVFFGDNRDKAHVEAKAYRNSELSNFRDWLENIYTYERLPKYLKGKYPDAYQKLMSPQLSLNFDKSIS
jgi:hypothetical protein